MGTLGIIKTLLKKMQTTLAESIEREIDEIKFLIKYIIMQDYTSDIEIQYRKIYSDFVVSSLSYLQTIWEIKKYIVSLDDTTRLRENVISTIFEDYEILVFCQNYVIKVKNLVMQKMVDLTSKYNNSSLYIFRSSTNEV